MSYIAANQKYLMSEFIMPILKQPSFVTAMNTKLSVSVLHCSESKRLYSIREIFLSYGAQIMRQLIYNSLNNSNWY